MVEPIFLNQTVNSSKKTKNNKTYGLVRPCSVFKIAYISHGAIVISHISFHWSDKNYEQDMVKSLVEFRSVITDKSFSKMFFKDFSLGLSYRADQRSIILSRSFWTTLYTLSIYHYMV